MFYLFRKKLFVLSEKYLIWIKLQFIFSHSYVNSLQPIVLFLKRFKMNLFQANLKTIKLPKSVNFTHTRALRWRRTRITCRIEYWTILRARVLQSNIWHWTVRHLRHTPSLMIEKSLFVQLTPRFYLRLALSCRNFFSI